MPYYQKKKIIKIVSIQNCAIFLELRIKHISAQGQEIIGNKNFK